MMVFSHYKTATVVVCMIHIYTRIVNNYEFGFPYIFHDHVISLLFFTKWLSALGECAFSWMRFSDYNIHEEKYKFKFITCFILHARRLFWWC